MATAIARETEVSQDQQWRKIGVLGTALNGVLMLAFMLLIGEFIIVFPIFAAIFFAFAALTHFTGQTRRWPWAVLGILTAVYILANIPFLVHDLAHPEEAFVFVPTMISLVLAIVVIVASVMVFFRRSVVPRPLLMGATAIVVVAALLSVVSMTTLDGHAQQPGDLVVTEEFPDRLDLPAGTHWIYLQNGDRVRHTFVVDDLDIHLEMPSAVGRRAEVTLPAGEYHYYCDVPGHESMKGTLVVGTP